MSALYLRLVELDVSWRILPSSRTVRFKTKRTITPFLSSGGGRLHCRDTAVEDMTVAVRFTGGPLGAEKKCTDNSI